MHTWPLEIRFAPHHHINEGDIHIGGAETFHHGWLAAADQYEAYPNGLMPLYLARIAEFSGAFGEQKFGKRLIIDLEDSRWNALDLIMHNKLHVIPSDDVFHANAERIREAIRRYTKIDQELQVWGNELYCKMLIKLHDEIKDSANGKTEENY